MGKKIIKLPQKSILYVLKYVTDGFRILHPLLLPRQLFLLFPDNTNVGIVQDSQRKDEVYDVLPFMQPMTPLYSGVFPVYSLRNVIRNQRTLLSLASVGLSCCSNNVERSQTWSKKRILADFTDITENSALDSTQKDAALKCNIVTAVNICGGETPEHTAGSEELPSQEVFGKLGCACARVAWEHWSPFSARLDIVFLKSLTVLQF